MMKKKMFGPLLLLLLLAVTPRNSSANPLVLPTVNGTTERAPARMSSTIANYMKAGADALTVVMTWLKDNKLPSSNFDKSILNLKNQIIKLPIELAGHRRDIFVGLFKAQDRLKQLNTNLELAAEILGKQCRALIRIYNDHGCSNELLEYSASLFVDFVNIVKIHLNRALALTKEIQDLLSASKTFSMDFNANQDYGKEEIRAQRDTAGYNISYSNTIFPEIIVEGFEHNSGKKTFLSCTFTSVMSCTWTIASTDEAVADKNTIDKQRELLKQVHASATTLLPQVENVKVYLANEIDLITGWQNNFEVLANEIDLITNRQNYFEVAVLENEVNCECEVIEESLLVLIKACKDYIDSFLLDTLQLLILP